MLQEAGVAVVVLAAVAFLVRRFVGRPSTKPTAVTFVPIAKLKKKPGDGCH